MHSVFTHQDKSKTCRSVRITETLTIQGIISRGRQFFREKFHDFREWVNNDRFREDYKSHSEEVVAGEKMAVKRMVHDKSFEAPC